MPFNIQTSSTEIADVKRHFTNSIQEEENGNLLGSFRGRPLNGRKLQLNEDFVGLVCNESQILSSFKELTYFNLDCPTTNKDSIARSIQWLSLSKILHE